MFGGFLGAIVQVGVKQWLFANVPDICQPEQRDHLICPHNGVFFTASAIWGLIGPTRQFGPGTLYHGHLYALIVGAFLPIPFWLWQRYYPKTRLRYINIPVILNGPTYIPPARGINYSSWFLTGFIFREFFLFLCHTGLWTRPVFANFLPISAEFYVRRRNFRWWAKFNYVLSAALDSGTIIALVVIFLTLQLPFTNSKSGSLNVKWWGNTVIDKSEFYLSSSYREPFTDEFVPSAALDADPIAYRLLAKGQSFDDAPNGQP
jgi:hypothetical protein